MAPSRATVSPPRRAATIDGNYELIKRVLANGTVVRAPDVMAIYVMNSGKFSLNLFFKNPDGTLASESSVGRYSFNASNYCEWVAYTTRNNLGRPGAFNDPPILADHCASVARKNGRFIFRPPGEGVEMSVGPEGFVAKIDGGETDYWTKIR